jgi:pimeloyl-ACP methyl ester carboxylesterase
VVWCRTFAPVPGLSASSLISRVKPRQRPWCSIEPAAAEILYFRRRLVEVVHHEAKPTVRPSSVGDQVTDLRGRAGYDKYRRDFSKLIWRLASPEVPAITLEGDANGAPHLDASAYAGKFPGTYEHRVIKGGIGHNLPQEAPQAFAQAVIDVAGL